jgi:hypothetical protein
MADMMSTKVATKRRKGKTPVAIEPSGDGPGLYRVRYADGTLSDAMGLTEAREALTKEGWRAAPARD